MKSLHKNTNYVNNKSKEGVLDRHHNRSIIGFSQQFSMYYSNGGLPALLPEF